jgi:hypothetical protein
MKRRATKGKRRGECMKKPYLIAEILLRRGMPDYVIKEVTALEECELFLLKRKWGLYDRKTGA